MENLLNELEILLTKWKGNTAPSVALPPVLDPDLAPIIHPKPDYLTFTSYPKIYTWAKAIAPEEGARPDLNNPGDLKVTETTKTWGATNGFQAKDGGWIAKFPDFNAGFKAQCNLLTLIAANEAIGYHIDRTFEGVMKVYANNPLQSYIDGIAKLISCELSTDVSSFLS